jgi:hypothetical protein
MQTLSENPVSKQSGIVCQNQGTSTGKSFGLNTYRYSGKQEQCVQACNVFATVQKVKGELTVKYFPQAQFSSGGCTCCGVQ